MKRVAYLKHWIENIISKELKLKKKFLEFIGVDNNYTKEELKEMESSWNKSTKNLTLIEAMSSNRPFTRAGRGEYSQYFSENTGPNANLVGCGYFIVDYNEDLENGTFTTSIDLYYDDIIAKDWEII